MSLHLSATLLGLVLFQAPELPPLTQGHFAAQPSLRIAGLCVGSAQDCLREAISDGDLSSEEVALPYEVLIAFAHNSADLTPEAQADLRALAEVLNEPLLMARTFVIEGHTDAKGDELYNQRLSERRASAVREYLVSAGVDPSRLTSIGFGETRPRADDPRAPENRRVELKIVP